MATLADLVKRQKSSGSSRTGALLSAVGKKTLETLDPRKLFNQSGLLTALFPSLKTFKTDSSRSKVDTASKELSGSTAPILEQMVMRLEGLDSTMRLVAKNTMAMPGMSRDMNVMRQNMIRLVRLLGGKASTKADSFFLRAFERERATESELQAAKERRETGKASAVTSIKEKASSIPGLGMLIGLVTAIQTFGSNLIGAVGSLTNLLAPLLKGGISLLFDMAGSFTKLAIKGGGTLFDFIKKIPLSKMLRGLLSFISSKGALGLLAPAAAAGLLAYLYTSEATQFGDDPNSFLNELGMPEAPEAVPIPTPISAELQQRITSRENMRKSDDPAVRAAAESLDKTNPLPKPSTTPPSTSPTPTSAPVSTSPTSVPNKSVTSGPDGELLDFIAAKESGGNYNAVFGQGSVPGLTDMTIAEVLDYQKQLIAQGQKSSAVGRYQFIRNSLAEEAAAAGIDINKEKFTPENQDKLILHRLKRIRGLDKFKRGELSQQQFAENLSMEFASLPSPIRGGGNKSFYEGIAGNKSLTSMENVYAAISPRTSSTQLAEASTTVDSARMAAMTPSAIIPAITSLASPKTPSPQRQQVTIPSTIDNELFEGLIARVSEYA